MWAQDWTGSAGAAVAVPAAAVLVIAVAAAGLVVAAVVAERCLPMQLRVLRHQAAAAQTPMGFSLHCAWLVPARLPALAVALGERRRLYGVVETRWNLAGC